MKKLSTLLVVFLMGWTASNAALPAEDGINRGYTNSFIFLEGGIEFAVFPDGQFDFNYLNNRPQLGVSINTPNANFSFNTGFDYDRFVQYDTYGAVIQIENTPIFYDGYGRVNQIGDIFINYRNGYVNRLGGLNVYYNGPGVIINYTGFINRYNRYYVYQPWHEYYFIPRVNRRVAWQNPYRLYYNPVRYSWNHHRNYWNSPGYYNGCYVAFNVRRDFYRPNQPVRYRSFERGRRDHRGRAVAYNNRARTERAAIATGRRDVRRSEVSARATATNNSSRNTAAARTRTNTSNRATASTRGTVNRDSAASRSTVNRSSSAVSGRVSQRNSASSRSRATVNNNTPRSNRSANTVNKRRTRATESSQARTNRNATSVSSSNTTRTTTRAAQPASTRSSSNERVSSAATSRQNATSAQRSTGRDTTSGRRTTRRN